MPDYSELKEFAKTIRLDVLDMVFNAQSGHIGGAFSSADIIAALYGYKMRVDSKNPQWEDRDRLVLSKGHSAPAVYSALARKGFFPIEDLKYLRQVNSHLQGAATPKTPGVDMSSGPLGQGLSSAVGIALASRINNKDYCVYCIIGDGECQEGQIWEAAMTAAKYKLENLICILDWNKVQMSGTNDEIMPILDPAKKFEAFGFRVIKINGNRMEEVVKALEEATTIHTSQPVAIIADTIKGRGVSYMEGLAMWHGKAPNEEQYRLACEELERGLEV